MRLRLSARSIVLIGIAVGIVTLCLAPAAMAQSGGIAVCVVDDEGEPLAGATVEISSSRQLTKTTAQLTGASGCTQFPVLRVGAGYELLVSMPGFSSYVLPNIRVRSGQQIPQKIALTAELTERVQVFGRTEVVDLSDATSTTKFDDTFIENLPVSGRFYQNVLALAPGVQDDDGDGNPNVHGSRERNFRAVVDGVANTDPLTGEWLSLLNTDAIEEMEIVGTGAGVEYGRASGGFARIVQKQGSNDFEGLFSFIWRSSELDGGAPGDIGGTPKSDSYEWLQPAFQLSGPIIKDKLWYRLSHEWIDREDPIVTLSGSMKTGRKQTIISDQLTWQVSPRNKLSFTYQEDPTTITNFGVSSRVPASSSQRVERGGPTFKVNWTAPLSPRLLVDSTFAYQDLDRGFFPTNPDQANSCALYGEFGGGFEPLNRASCLDDRTGVVSGAASDTWQDRRQRLTVSSQATLFINKFLGMSHRLKFGFGSENERYFRSLTRTPSMNFLVEVPPIGTPIGRSFVRASAPNSVANAATGNNWSAYLEDQFRPVQNLSITMGLRFDREEIFAPGQQTFDPAAESEEYQRRRESFPNANPGRLATTLFTGFADVQQFQFLLAETLGASLSQLNLGAGAAASTFWVRQRQEGEMQIINNNVSPRFSIAWDPFGNAQDESVGLGRSLLRQDLPSRPAD